MFTSEILKKKLVNLCLDRGDLPSDMTPEIFFITRRKSETEMEFAIHISDTWHQEVNLVDQSREFRSGLASWSNKHTDANLFFLLWQAVGCAVWSGIEHLGVCGRQTKLHV